ncbi:MAG: hypothetical protein ACLRZ7_09500 [Lachnospiraceae bacterium]
MKKLNYLCHILYVIGFINSESYRCYKLTKDRLQYLNGSIEKLE